MKSHLISDINKKDLKEAIEAKGTYLPSLKSAAFTFDYMEGVVAGKFFSVKLNEIKEMPT